MQTICLAATSATTRAAALGTLLLATLLFAPPTAAQTVDPVAKHLCFDAPRDKASYEMEAGCSKLLETPGGLSDTDKNNVLYRRALLRFNTAEQTAKGMANRAIAMRAGFADLDTILATPGIGGATRSDVQLLRYRALVINEDRSGAQAALAASIAADPKNIDAIDARLREKQDRGDYRGMLDDVNAIIRIVEPDPNRKQILGTYLNERCWANTVYLHGDLKVARADCDRAISLNPAAHIYDSRGMIGLLENDNLRAYADYAHAVELAPKYASGLFGRGVSQRRLGRTADGDADIAAAKAIDPKIAETYAKNGVTP